MANLKNIKKGDKVILRMFTGAFVEAKEVEMADAKRVGFTNKKGIKMVFDKATGKQVQPEPKSEKFANYIEEYDADVEKAEIEKKASKAKKSATATAKAEKPAKAAKKSTSKKAKEVEPEEPNEDEIDDEDEDFDDDEEEE